MKVKLSKDNVAFLQGKICPFRNPLVLPGAIQGQIEIQGMPCTSECTHFTIEPYTMQPSSAHVSITCGCKTMEFDADIEKESTLNIIK